MEKGDSKRTMVWDAGRGAPEADPVGLSLWLGARLPLSTSVRLHLLSCACPLKRLRDCVDVMRLLSDDGQGGSRYTPPREDGLPKFEIVYDTAEASGCELEPPREIVDWARAPII